MARPVASSRLLLALVLAAGSIGAEEVEKVDAEFLEFLGSLDSDDEAWSEFLATTDVGKASPAPDAAKSGKVKDPER